jgi:hypothetical protein
MSQEASETPKFRDLGGGLLALLVHNQVAHWNTSIPGRWRGPKTLDEVGSYASSFCGPYAGVYRLIGLDEDGKPAVLDRICGRDRTGTLYIGCDQNLGVRSRLSQLVRSLEENSGWKSLNREHNAGYRLRAHQTLSQRFSTSRLAITWCYIDQCRDGEAALLRAYYWSFGEDPPLNRR